MKIEIWSDYVCPFCYIGERKLSEALRQTKMEDNVEIVFNSFELNPEGQESYDYGINELIANKYGISLERAIESNKSIVMAAKSVGLDFNFDDIKPTNTFKAHRLSFYAKEQGKLKEYTESIMENYFVKSKNISNIDTLTSIASEVGLDKKRVSEILNSDQYTDEVRSNENSARQRNITGVPYFLIDGKEAINGAQPVEVFVEIINRLNK